MYRSIFWKYMYNIPWYTVNNWNHHQIIVNTNTWIVTLYFIHSTCLVLEILFKSISNHHWSLRKNESEQTSLWYGISTISTLRWSCTNSLFNTTYSFSTFFYEDLLYNSKLWEEIVQTWPFSWGQKLSNWNKFQFQSFVVLLWIPISSSTQHSVDRISLLLSTSIDSDSLRSWADEKSLNIFLQERKQII